MPLIGVIIGGLLTYFTQAKIATNQLKREKEREKENKKAERFIVYNEVLKIDGEIQMLYINSHIAEFNLQAYREKIRPLFYTRFHLLHEEIANSVRLMDIIISEADLSEELLLEEGERLIAFYSKILTEIEKEMKSYRETIEF